MTGIKQSNFTKVTSVDEADNIPLFTGSENKRITYANMRDQLTDEIAVRFIYPTTAQLQQSNLEADEDEPNYVRCEETEYRLYKITALVAGVDDIALDNGMTATYQEEYSKSGFVLGAASSTNNALALFDGTTGTQLKTGVVLSTIGGNLASAASIAQVSYPRVDAANAVTMATPTAMKTDLNLPSNAAASISNIEADISTIEGDIVDINSDLATKVQTVETFAALATTAAPTAGMIVYLKQHTSGGLGGGHFQDTAGTITNNGGTLINNSVTSGRHWKRTGDSIYLEDFGGINDGVTDCSTAFNAAIAFANAKGGDDASNITGTTINVGEGRFLINSALNPITASGVNIAGQSENGTVLLLKNGTTTFTWGNGGTTTVVGGGISNCKIEYLTAPSATTIAINVNGAFRLSFNDLLLVNAGTLASLGVSYSAIAGGVSFSNINGFVNNGGLPLFDLRYGAGLFLDNVHVFVGGVGNPKNTTFTASFATSVMTVTVAPSVALAIGDRVHGVGIADNTTITSFGTGTGGTGTYNLSTSLGTLSARTVNATADMTTVAGTNVFRCDVGFWDTIQSTNCLFERFYIVLAVNAGSGMVYQNFFFSNFVADYNKQYVCYLESQSGGVVSGIRFSKDSWFSCWNADAFIFIGAGYHDNHDINGMITIAGLRGVYYALANAKSNTFSLAITSVNRIGTAAAAFDVAANSTGFHLSNSTGNIDTANLGLPWRAGYGVQVLADCDYFSVTGCDFDGSISGYNVDPVNAAGSANRNISGNLRANYAINTVIAVPATSVNYTNKTAMVQEWHLFGGTITSGYVKKGAAIGVLPYFSMRLHPNDTFSVGYSAVPTAKTFIEP